MRIPGGEKFTAVRHAAQSLHTVCLEARCPNIGECFCAGHAAFLILGNVCTRNCRYCAVAHGTPSEPDPDEPERIAGAAAGLNLSYVVLTSVTRDDLRDGGAGHFEACVSALRKNASCGIELLIPDFRHTPDALKKIFDVKPDVINHNIEIVRGLFPALRPQGDYDVSLSVLRSIADAGFPAKSGLMIGFGETAEDIDRTLDDLREAGCSMLTVGQYLRSHRDGFRVAKYYEPSEFDLIAEKAKRLGFSHVLSGPMVRSSYHAALIEKDPVR
jgi:lipoic acid synthetase